MYLNPLPGFDLSPVTSDDVLDLVSDFDLNICLVLMV